MIVVDGALISNQYVGVGGDSWAGSLPIDYGNAFTDLNPDDFESVSVLKGPKAGAIYGSRASNGVLVIKTKSGAGKKGLGITLSSGFSADVVNRFWDEQNEYGGGGYNSNTKEYNQYRANWGGNFGPKTNGQLISQATPDDSNPEATPFLQRADREGFFRAGFSQNHNLALSYSDENSWGRVSLGYLTKQGVVPNTDYKKNSLSLNIGHKITSKLKLNLAGSYISSGSGNIPEIGFHLGGQGGLMYHMLWVMKNFDLNDYRDYWLPGKEYKQQNYFISWGTNPYLIVYENLNGFDHDRLFGNLKATYEFTNELSAFVRVAMDRYSDLRTSRRPAGQPGFKNGFYREQEVSVSELNTDFYVTYVKSINEDISFEANLGGNIYTQDIINKVSQTNHLNIPGIYSLSNALDVPRISQYRSEKQINSIYGSTQLGYKDYLFIDVTARNDWSSTLPLDNNSFFYPSVGLSAVISKMISLPEEVSLIRFRTSWAQTGNDTDPFLTKNVLALGTLPGSLTNSEFLVNPNLKPESTSAFEVGLDLGFLKNRLRLTVDYYLNTTKDQILRAPVSQASGATQKLINAGEIESQGFEILLNATPIVYEGFKWDVTLNWNMNRAKVVTLGPDIESFVIAQGPEGATIEARPGGLMGDIYGRGFARSPDGQIIYDEILKDGKPTGVVAPRLDNTKKKLGNYNPDWTMGVTNNFEYKGVQLKVFFDYRHGGDFYSLTASQLYRSGSITETLPYRESDITPAGVVENKDGSYSTSTLTSPGYDYYRNYYKRENIEANTYDATFLKLRELSLGADLTQYFDGLPFESLSVSFFGRNLWVWSKEDFLRHFDPEVLTFNGGSYVRGFETGQLPGTATYGFNIKIGI